MTNPDKSKLSWDWSGRARLTAELAVANARIAELEKGEILLRQFLADALNRIKELEVQINPPAYDTGKYQ